MNNSISKLPNYELHLPHLTTVLVPRNGLSTISNELVGGMKEVRVLDMSWNKITSLPQSLMLLTKLRMLDLRGNKYLREISILGELKELEILILSKTRIKEITQEIGQLVNLRRFDIGDCEYLSHISPGVITNLHWLEELCIGFFKMQDKDIFDRLVEVMKLSKLTYLDLLVPCLDVIPKDFNWGKSNSFVIKIGGYINHSFGSVSERRLEVSYDSNNPNISLESMENMNPILSDLNRMGFNKFESIRLDFYPNVRWLVDLSKEHQLGDEPEEKFFMNLKHLRLSLLGSLEVVWKCPDEYISRYFSNLVTFDIVSCHKLVRLFSMVVAQGLVSLQEMNIKYCTGLEEVIWGGDDEEIETTESIIVFPSLVKVSLIGLDSLKSFCSGNSTIKYPSLVQVYIIRCDNMNKWGNGIQETPNLKFLNQVLLDDGPNAINVAVEKFSET